MAGLSTVLDGRYIFEYQVGLWTYGTVQVLRERERGTMTTCKVVPKAPLRSTNGVLNKLKQLRGLQHKHISTIGSVQEDKNNFYILSSKTDGGDVADWLERLEEGFCIHENTCAAYLRQVLSAFTYCHAHKVFHGDLSPGSLLLSSKMPDAVVKVGDFGIAQILDPDQMLATKTTSSYLPPEVRSGEHLGAGSAQDMWSIGAVAHAFLVGQPPNSNIWGMRGGIFKGSFEEAWSERSPEARDFVARLLLPAEERPTAAQMLNHPWLRGAAISEIVSSSSSNGGAAQDGQLRMLCYMLAVLLIPTLVPHRDFEQLRVPFAQADQDNDGLVPRSVAKGILRRRCTVEEAVTTSLNICDVSRNEVLDLCSIACADLISREFFAAGPTSQPISCPLHLSELAPRMLRKFFEKYGEQKQPPATVQGISMRIRTATAQDMETYTSVRYDEILTSLPEDAQLNEQLLTSHLSAGAGVGTPLVPVELQSVRSDGPSCGVEGFDNLVLSIFQSCGFGAAGLKTMRAGGC